MSKIEETILEVIDDETTKKAADIVDEKTDGIIEEIKEVVDELADELTQTLEYQEASEWQNYQAQLTQTVAPLQSQIQEQTQLLAATMEVLVAMADSLTELAASIDSQTLTAAAKKESGDALPEPVVEMQPEPEQAKKSRIWL